MGDGLRFERFIRFNESVNRRKYPNAAWLAKEFEISVRTAQRDIAFFQNRFPFPLQYSPARKGYYYKEGTFQLPDIILSEENITALALAVRLASSVPDGGMKRDLQSFLESLLRRTGNKKLRLKTITERVAIKNIEYSPAAGADFHTIAEALFNRRLLQITYHSPHTGQSSQRDILPLHLLLYMGNWHIIAYCTVRQGLRDFLISRIRSVKPALNRQKLPRALPAVKDYVRRNFGIMQGGQGTQVALKFTPQAAAWVREQIWHPAQKAAVGKDGSLTLRFPVADLREVKRRVLSYGAEVKVLAPKRLAGEIGEEIKKMMKNY